MKINNVVSLFDGIGCGIQALKDSGVEFKNYYASEIDKNAMRIAQHNHPEIVPVGDVRNLNGKDFKNVDLLIAGSPCQNFSFCGTRKGMVTKEGHDILSLEQYLKLKNDEFEFEGESYLFWEFVRLLDEIKPKYFLLENVKMYEKWEVLISVILGTVPLKINSARLVPQNRFRNYWTNIPSSVPEDRSPELSNFIRQGVTGVGFRGVKDPSKPIKNGKVGYTITKQIRKDNIANAILTSLGSAEKGSGTGHYLTVDGAIRTFTSAECEILQGLPEGYTNVNGISEGRRIHGIGNAWTVPVISHIFNGIQQTAKLGSKPKQVSMEERKKHDSERPITPHYYHWPKGW